LRVSLEPENGRKQELLGELGNITGSIDGNRAVAHYNAESPGIMVFIIPDGQQSSYVVHPEINPGILSIDSIKIEKILRINADKMLGNNFSICSFFFIEYSLYRNLNFLLIKYCRKGESAYGNSYSQQSF